MCSRIILAAFFSLVLSSALWSQDVPSDTPTLTPKEQALKLLDSLEQNNNEVLNSLDQSQTELDRLSKLSDSLKDSLKKTASYSESLEQSLNLYLMVNRVAIPVGAIAVTVAIVEAAFLLSKK